MFRHVASMIFVWTMQPLDAGWKPLARRPGSLLQLLWPLSPQWCLKGVVLWLLWLIVDFPIKMVIFNSYVKLPEGNQFFFSVLPFRIRSQTIMWPASKITMTPSDTINAGCSGPGWREAIWWRPLVMNPVKSHSWSLVFWSWKLRPLLCASAMFKLIHHGCATRLFCRGPMKMKDFKMLQVFFFLWKDLEETPLGFGKKQCPNFTHLFSWLEWWGPRHVQPPIPHQLTRRPRHGGWHETVTWYRWNPNCSKPIWVCLKIGYIPNEIAI